MRLKIFGTDETAKVSARSLRLYLLLTAWGGPDRSAHLSAPEIRKKLRMGRANLVACLNELKEVKWISHEYDYKAGAVWYRLTDKPGITSTEMHDERALSLACCRLMSIKVYFLLSSHVGKGGCCWPSRRRIAGLVGRSVRTVERSIKMLTDLGLFTKERVAWCKVRGFKFMKPRRFPLHPRKKITVYHRLNPFAKVSLTPFDKRREVMKTLNFEICRSAWRDGKIVLDATDLPEELRQIPAFAAGIGERNLANQLHQIGMTRAQAAWTTLQFPARTIWDAMQSLFSLTVSKAPKDPIRYLVGTMQRMVNV